jgi:hypothetical protein
MGKSMIADGFSRQQLFELKKAALEAAANVFLAQGDDPDPEKVADDVVLAARIFEDYLLSE